MQTANTGTTIQNPFSTLEMHSPPQGNESAVVGLSAAERFWNCWLPHQGSGLVVQLQIVR